MPVATPERTTPLQITTDPEIAPSGPRLVERLNGGPAGNGWSGHNFSLETIPLLREALMLLPQPLMVTDPEMRLALTNHAWQDTFPVAAADMLPLAPVQPTIERIAATGEYGPGSSMRHAAFRKEAIRSGHRFQLERQRPGGVHLLVAGCPMPGGGYLTLLTDISAQRQSPDALALRKELEALRTANRELDRLAATDPLLGIANRRGLLRFAMAEAARLGREGGSCALMLLDLDHFKAINDRHGHAGGDLVLKAVATTLRGALREGDHLARHGGEELVALAPRTGASQGHEIAERLREALAHTPVALPTATLGVTASVGVTAWQAGEGFEEALMRADQGLYLAKRAGRNRVVSVPA
ncbi:Diguanilate cyclase [Roseomonas mucosa]|uniref:GGDEF domain-containing protein n=1 Tax=Roseomonas mucosa TaxID=207340 RepID=UPI00220C5C16|nr:sensor domain-containing diguanylate cyclase [Roseomonas mucosa]QDJ09119.1 Diguanilate cyclase [Roseomonas mucosa]